MSDWAAKVLAGVPRYDPFWNRLVMITAKDGDYVEYDDALAAIDKLGAGDGLVNAVYLRDIDGTGSLHVCSKGDPGAIAHVPAAHIAALTAQLEEKEEQLVSVLRREAATHERHDAKVAQLEALNPNRPNELTTVALQPAADARAEALREAAAVAFTASTSKAPGTERKKIAAAILALIPETKP